MYDGPLHVHEHLLKFIVPPFSQALLPQSWKKRRNSLCMPDISKTGLNIKVSLQLNVSHGMRYYLNKHNYYNSKKGNARYISLNS